MVGCCRIRRHAHAAHPLPPLRAQKELELRNLRAGEEKRLVPRARC